jgi:uncharacterized phage-associated protein
MYKVIDIANKILKEAAEGDENELVSNMKLQKLLYYQQGFHLAYFNTPLFEEEIEAWIYGPVIPQIYHAFMEYGKNGIEYGGETIKLTEPGEESLFHEVNQVYGALSAVGLMRKTHDESPWKTTPTGAENVISKEKIKAYFQTQLL